VIATSELQVGFSTGAGRTGASFIDPRMNRRNFDKYFFSNAASANWADCNMGSRAVLVKGLGASGIRVGNPLRVKV
jgi:hypothetical protein